MEKYPHLNEAVAKILRERRAQLGMSKRKLSEEAMIERAYILGLEQGKWNVSLNVLFFLCDALKIDAVDFMRQVKKELEKFGSG